MAPAARTMNVHSSGVSSIRLLNTFRGEDHDALFAEISVHAANVEQLTKMAAFVTEVSHVVRHTEGLLGPS